ncbi:MAG: Lrp/AsnC family transcriptional regulator [Nanoarchaeota archaeon]|nr:Lrp/AsnC family transcriptional regulator [Nanoarchaeota archaeon]
MIRAYLLLITKPGVESRIASKLINIKEVKDIEVVYGDYDIVIKVEFPNMDELSAFIKKLRAIKNIKNTSTMIAMQ